MSKLDIHKLIGIIGLFAIFLGLLIAFIQTRKIRALDRERERKLWTNIAATSIP
jgi:hypothetical protein